MIEKRANGAFIWIWATLALAVLVAAPASLEGVDPLEWSAEPTGLLRAPTLPALPNGGVQLVLDDDETPEAEFGFGGQTAQQFLWFNRFTPTSSFGFRLEEIWVLFTPGPNKAVGDAIQLAVYQDDDENPANGAQLLATFDVTIQILDGVTYSVYPLATPVVIEGGTDALIGVVNRFVETGVTGPTNPAAIDTTASQGRSWFALWMGDPPALPTLPPDLTMALIDPLVSGNWLIRGFGTGRQAVEVPAVQPVGLLLLVLGLGVTGVLALASRRT